MSKSKQGLSKKGLPSMRRITNTNGERVWLVNKEEIKTLREVIRKYRKQ